MAGPFVREPLSLWLHGHTRGRFSAIRLCPLVWLNNAKRHFPVASEL